MWSKWNAFCLKIVVVNGYSFFYIAITQVFQPKNPKKNLAPLPLVDAARFM